MLSKLFALVFTLMLGAGAGLVASPAQSERMVFVLSGMLAALVVWHLYSTWIAHRFVFWLEKATFPESQPFMGVWSNVADRIRRLLKNKDVLRLASEENLRQFLAAIQASPNGVILLDEEMRIQWSNQTASQHLGIDPKVDLQQLIGNMLRSPGFNSYLHERSFDHEVIVEGRHHRVDSPHRIGIQLFPYGEGQLLLLSRDVTLMEQAETMRRDFVSNVSHEIRTPLTVLAGFIETLQTLKLEAEDQQHYLSLMAKQATRMQSLVDDLLTLSKLEERQHRDHGEWVSLPGLLQSVIDEAQSLTEKLNPPPASPHRIEYIDHDSIIDTDILGAPTELLSAFSNLLSNAIRHTPAGGQIKVTWTMKEGEGVFTVQDKGPGISPEHLPRLAQRFYRVDRSRSRETGGTGLGLAIVKHIMQRHQGRLLIDSRLNEGSHFSLVFPAERLRIHRSQKETLLKQSAD